MQKLSIHTPQSGFIHEISAIKGSRFIGLIFVVQSKDEVKNRLDEVRQRYIDATHHCYAYRIGGLVKSFDDGEPSGTAGKPILSALQRSGFDNIVLIVVRYFGGTMLGASGLIRAYGECARQVLTQVPIMTQEDTKIMIVSITYQTLPHIMQLCRHYDATVIQEESSLLTQKLCITINTAYYDMFTQQLQDIDQDNAIL